MTGFAQGQLRSIVERIERLEEEKAAIAADIKEIYAEAKGNGFDTKVLRAVVSLRKKDAAERQEQEALLDVYLVALGMAVEPDDDEPTQSAGEPVASLATDREAVDTADSRPIAETHTVSETEYSVISETHRDVPPVTRDGTAADVPASASAATYSDDGLDPPPFLKRPAPDRVVDRVLP